MLTAPFIRGTLRQRLFALTLTGLVIAMIAASAGTVIGAGSRNTDRAGVATTNARTWATLFEEQFAGTVAPLQDALNADVAIFDAHHDADPATTCELSQAALAAFGYDAIVVTHPDGAVHTCRRPGVGDVPTTGSSDHAVSVVLADGQPLIRHVVEFETDGTFTEVAIFVPAHRYSHVLPEALTVVDNTTGVVVLSQDLQVGAAAPERFRSDQPGEFDVAGTNRLWRRSNIPGTTLWVWAGSEPVTILGALDTLTPIVLVGIAVFPLMLYLTERVQRSISEPLVTVGNAIPRTLTDDPDVRSARGAIAELQILAGGRPDDDYGIGRTSAIWAMLSHSSFAVAATDPDGVVVDMNVASRALYPGVTDLGELVRVPRGFQDVPTANGPIPTLYLNAATPTGHIVILVDTRPFIVNVPHVDLVAAEVFATAVEEACQLLEQRGWDDVVVFDRTGDLVGRAHGPVDHHGRSVVPVEQPAGDVVGSVSARRVTGDCDDVLSSIATALWLRERCVTAAGASLLDSTGTAFTIETDTNGIVRAVSEQLRAEFDLPADLVGTPGLDLVHPDDRDRLNDALDQLFRHAQNTEPGALRTHHEEWTTRTVRVRHGEGWARASVAAQVVGGEFSDAGILLAVSEDPALLQARSRFERVTEAVPVGVIAADMRTGWWANSAARQILGTSTWEPGWDTALERFRLLDGDIRRLQDYVNGTDAGPLRIKGTWRQDDGKLVYLNAHLATFDQGTATLVVLEDITETQERLTELAELERIVQAVSETVLTVEPDGTVGFMNAPGRTLFNLDDRVVAEGLTLVELAVDEEGRSHLERALAQARSDGSWSGDVTFRSWPDLPVDCAVSATAVDDRVAGNRRLVVVIRDVSAERSAATRVRLQRVSSENELRRATNARMHMQRQLLDERNRLAGVLSDDIAQALHSMRLQVEAARTAPAAAGSLLDQVTGELAATLERIESAAAELRPDLLRGVGLAAALEDLVGQAAKTYGFKGATVDADDFTEPESAVAFLVFSAARDAIMASASRSPTTLDVRLSSLDGAVVAVLQDDGELCETVPEAASFSAIVAAGGETTVLLSPGGRGCRLRLVVPAAGAAVPVE